MATGIQGPQGFKGARGVQGATGWGAIGNATGPTGPTGPIGYFQYLDTKQAEGTLELSGSTVSTLYRVTTGVQGTILLSLDTTVPEGGFYVFTNQSAQSCVFSATGPTPGFSNIDGASQLTLPVNRSVMLISRGATGFASSYLYSGVGSTGLIEGNN
jgi:hypothetical protein